MGALLNSNLFLNNLIVFAGFENTYLEAKYHKAVIIRTWIIEIPILALS